MSASIEKVGFLTNTFVLVNPNLLSKLGFRRRLAAAGIDLTEGEFEATFAHYDPQHSGLISWNDFAASRQILKSTAQLH